MGAAEALLEGSEAAGYSHTPNRAAPGAAVRAARARMAEQAFGEAWAEGRAMTPERIVEYARTRGRRRPASISSLRASGRRVR